MRVCPMHPHSLLVHLASRDVAFSIPSSCPNIVTFDSKKEEEELNKLCTGFKISQSMVQTSKQTWENKMFTF